MEQSNEQQALSLRTVRWVPDSRPPEIRYERFSVGLSQWLPVSKEVISGWLKAGIVVCYNPTGDEW